MMEPTDELAADAATRRHMPTSNGIYTRKARSFERRRRLYREVATACAFADGRSFVPPSDGRPTFHRLGTRRRREFADKRSKLSWGAMKSGRYTELLRQLPSAAAACSVDPRSIADRRLRSAKNAQRRAHEKTKRQEFCSAGVSHPRADRHTTRSNAFGQNIEFPIHAHVATRDTREVCQFTLVSMRLHSPDGATGVVQPYSVNYRPLQVHARAAAAVAKPVVFQILVRRLPFKRKPRLVYTYTKCRC